MNPALNNVLSRLKGVKKVAKGHEALCPAHNDTRPSLKIDEGDDGRVLLKCWAGCEVEGICRAIGLSVADLFPKNTNKRTGGRQEPEKVYDYVDKSGKLLYQAVRFPGKKFSQRRPDGAGGWIWKMDGVKRVLYRLPEVIQAVQTGEIIFICEGEKDVDRLRSLGLTATTNSGGAGKWRDRYSDYFRGASVVILPDNDEPGRRHAQEVARSLHGKVVSAKVLELPDLPEKGDVSDWIQAGGTREALLGLVEETSEWEPPPADITPIQTKKKNLLHDAILCLAEGAGQEYVRPEDLKEFERIFPRLKSGGDLTQAETRKAWRVIRAYSQVLDEVGIPFQDIPEPPCPTQAVRLLEIVEDNSIQFHDPAKTAYALVNIGDRQEILRVRSREFRLWLQGLYLAECGTTPASQAMADALLAVEGAAIHQRPCHPVYVRIAGHEGNIYLDLANDKGEAVEIAPEGWDLTTASPVLFRRPKGILPLPRPERGGSIDDLRPFLNTSGDEDSWILRIAFLLALLRPKGPYPVLNLGGEQGGGKSTEAKIIKSLADPTLAPLSSPPKELRDLAITANNSHTLGFDNISYVPDWFSDALCQLATGGGFRVRELYSDAEESIFDYTRPVILTGIGRVISRPDLLDRALMIDLPEIEEDDRRDEKVFWAEFEEARPRILGALLDAVAEGLRNIDNVKLDRLPRMADFAKWIVACEPALPWEPGAFMEAYAGNREDAVSLALEADYVAVAVKKFVKDKGGFEGTATELLDTLEDYVSEKTAKSKAWPKNTRTFGNRIKQVAPFLRRTGIDIETGIREGGTGRRLIRLKKESTLPLTAIEEEPLEDPW